MQHKTTELLPLRGKSQVGAICFVETGFLVTRVTCMATTCHCIPLLLFLRKKNHESRTWIGLQMKESERITNLGG